MWRARARAFTPLLLAQTRLDAFARSLQLSADGSVIWLQKGGGGVPPPSRFWGKMAAAALLLVPMVHVNQCEQETHWKHGDASTVTRTQRCICGVSRRDECYTNAFTSVALLRRYPLALCCGVALCFQKQPTCLAVSGKICLFLGGPDEPLCLFRVCQMRQLQRPASQNKNGSQFFLNIETIRGIKVTLYHLSVAFMATVINDCISINLIFHRRKRSTPFSGFNHLFQCFKKS